MITSRRGSTATSIPPALPGNAARTNGASKASFEFRNIATTRRAGAQAHRSHGPSGAADVAAVAQEHRVTAWEDSHVPLILLGHHTWSAWLAVAPPPGDRSKAVGRV